MPYADPAAKAEWARRYFAEHRDQTNEYKRRWARRNPEKRRAQLAVGNAIRDGRLVRGDECAVESPRCSGRIEAHHEDYARPLDVTWLCSRHHADTRKQDS